MSIEAKARAGDERDWKKETPGTGVAHCDLAEPSIPAIHSLVQSETHRLPSLLSAPPYYAPSIIAHPLSRKEVKLNA